MKKTGLFLSAFIAVMTLTAFTVQSIWNMDNDHSGVEFSVTNMGISDVSGRFDEFTATIKSSKEDFSDAVVEATIEVGSINTRVDARDAHLKTNEFFDVAQYPQITYKSTGVESEGNGKYKIIGDLTIKDITKEVALEFHYRGTFEDPQSKMDVAGFKLTGTISRSDFGVGEAFPDAVLSDDVAITINARFLK